MPGSRILTATAVHKCTDDVSKRREGLIDLGCLPQAFTSGACFALALTARQIDQIQLAYPDFALRLHTCACLPRIKNIIFIDVSPCPSQTYMSLHRIGVCKETQNLIIRASIGSHTIYRFQSTQTTTLVILFKAHQAHPQQPRVASPQCWPQDFRQPPLSP